MTKQEAKAFQSTTSAKATSRTEYAAGKSEFVQAHSG